MSSPGLKLLRTFFEFGTAVHRIDEAIQSASTEELRDALAYLHDPEFEKLRGLNLAPKIEAVLEARGALTADLRYQEMQRERIEDRRLARLALAVAIVSGMIALASLIVALSK